jgi:hypothetical protein
MDYFSHKTISVSLSKCSAILIIHKLHLQDNNGRVFTQNMLVHTQLLHYKAILLYAHSSSLEVIFALEKLYQK